MLRTTVIGLASAFALGVSLASPAGAIGGQKGGGTGGGGMGGHMGGGAGGGAIHGASGVGGGMTAVRSGASGPGSFAPHDMGRMRMGGDRDRDRDRDRDHDRFRHDHDRFRFFPTFAFGIDTYADDYDPAYGCWELHRVLTHGGWRLQRFWVCD